MAERPGRTSCLVDALAKDRVLRLTGAEPVEEVIVDLANTEKKKGGTLVFVTWKADSSEILRLVLRLLLLILLLL